MLRSSAAAMSMVALAGALALAACGSSGDDSSSAGKEASTGGGPIVIGAPISMTGPLAPYGKFPYQMARFAIEDINKSGGVLGGRQLKFAVEDDKSDYAANGAAAALKVLDQGAKIIVTDCDADWGAPAQTTAQSKGIGSLSFCAGAPQFGEKGLGPMTHSAAMATPNEATVSAEWSSTTKKWKSAYLLVDTTIAYDTSYCNSYKKRFEQLGGKVVGHDEFKQGDSSIASQVTRLKGTNPAPDVVVICSYTPGGGTAVRQIRAAGIETDLMFSDGLGAPNQWLASVPGLKNAWATTYAATDGTDEIAKINELSKRWETTYGNPTPSADTFDGYSAVQLIAAAIEKAGSDDPKAISTALSATEDVDTIYGAETFAPGYNISFTSPVAVVEVNDGKWTFVTRQRPEADATRMIVK